MGGLGEVQGGYALEEMKEYREWRAQGLKSKTCWCSTGEVGFLDDNEWKKRRYIYILYIYIYIQVGRDG